MPVMLQQQTNTAAAAAVANKRAAQSCRLIITVQLLMQELGRNAAPGKSRVSAVLLLLHSKERHNPMLSLVGCTYAWQ
jgi:hypothetical protein